MYQKYSIGKMASLLGISAEAIRYYESKDIIRPIRDPETGYRYYSTWDFHMLLRARHYQRYGFSLEEVSELFRSRELSFIQDRLQDQEAAMTAALCVSIMTLSNMCGRIGFGFIYDILKGWKSLILLMVINGASMLLLTQATSLPFFILCVVLVGFSFGGLLVVFAPMVRLIFGSKYYNSNYGLIFIGYGIGAFVGPKISAYFYDTTGQYTLGFVGSAILAVAAIVLVLVAQKLASKMVRS